MIGQHERIRLHVPHVEIAAQQLGQGDSLDLVELGRAERARPHSGRVLVVESIAPLQITELPRDQARERGPHGRACQRPLGQPAHKQVHVADGLVEALEPSHRVGRHGLGELVEAAEAARIAASLANLRVRGQAVVATALHVRREQVHRLHAPVREGHLEQVVLKVVVHARVESSGRLAHQTVHDALEAAMP